MSQIPNPIPVSQLFVPAPSGVGTSQGSVPAVGSYLSQLLANAATLQLPTTAWQSGSVERTILSIMSVIYAQQDLIVSTMAQGGFLDWAANGTVTYVALDGTTQTAPVTPDPTIPSQWPASWNGVWQPGWLDELASAVYNVQRIQATYATQLLAIVNTSGTTAGAFASGGYHVGNPTSGATYKNVSSLSIPPSAIAGTGGVVTAMSGTSTVTVTTQSAHGLATGAIVYITGQAGFVISPATTNTSGVTGTFATITVTGSTTFTLNGATGSGAWTSGGTVYLCTVASFIADLIGTIGSSVPYGVTLTITSNVGVSCCNVLAFVGAPYEANGGATSGLAYRCRLKLSALSPNGPSGAYQYFALTSSQLLAAETPSVSLDCGTIIQAQVQGNTLTGAVTVTLAGSTPASMTLGQPVVGGAALLAVGGCVGSSGQCKITAATAGLLTNDWVTVSGVISTTGGDCGTTGTWQIVVNDSTHLTLVGSTFSGTYSSGGSIEGGDLGQIDQLLRANVTPLGSTLTTQSAIAFPLTIVATVVVPSAYASQYVTSATAAMQAFVAALKLGGIVAGSPTSGLVPYDDVVGTLFAAGSQNGLPSYVLGITTCTVNGGTVDLAFPSSTSQAQLATFTLSTTKV